MKLEVLHVLNCPNLAPLLERLAEVTELPVTIRLIHTEADAAQFGMAGSPTLLIDGVDPFATDRHCGVSCRLYRDEQGQIVSAPSVEQLRAALEAADLQLAGEVLSTWKVRAVPSDPVEKAVHQSVLRAFAATGRPPTAVALDPLTAGRGRSTADVLKALHEADAIRLAPGGQIALAYPFSATPTRHRVRIDDQVDVYAMCAIDALGIAAMLGCDTQIESVDVTTGQPITVITKSGASTWEPKEAVVFIGADTGDGPSAEYCCDYLNFFADHEAAEAWARGNPWIPGQILDQPEAEQLGTHLFQMLLTN